MSKSYRSSSLLLIGLLTLAKAHGAPPKEITEPGSGQRFQSPLKLETESYTLIGTGLHRQKNEQLYAMALYVEDSARQSFIGVYDRAGRRRAGLYLENRAQNFFTWGHFSKLGVLRILAPFTREALQQSFRDGLADLLGPQAPADLRKDAQTFLSLFDTEVKPGQEIRIHSDDVGRLELYIDGKKKEGPQNSKLCRHIWDIWLGYHPATPSMRQTLVDRLDVLAT